MRGIRFRPHCWLAQEWFSPDGIPGIAIPFYLAHRRLMSIERRFMREVEGGNRNWLMRILRHEAGHAIDSAYRLRRRSRWRAVFGPASLPYPDTYRPRPGSRRFVQHLGAWYAQAHPTEDFAETFAVWLKPHSPWRREYRGLAGVRKAGIHRRARAAKSASRSRWSSDRSTIEDVTPGDRARCASTTSTSWRATACRAAPAPMNCCSRCSPRRRARAAAPKAASVLREMRTAAAPADPALRRIQRIPGASGAAADDRALRGAESVRARFAARTEGAAAVGDRAAGGVLRRAPVAAGRRCEEDAGAGAGACDAGAARIR